MQRPATMKLVRFLRLATFALLLPAFGASVPQDPAGESVLTIPDDLSCASCAINIEELATLGEEKGPGGVEVESTVVSRDPVGGFYMHTLGNRGRNVHVFDRTGALMTSLAGPRAFQSIVAVRTTEDGRIFVYDRNQSTAIVFSDERRFESEISLALEPTNSLAHLSDQLGVAATRVPTAQRAGFPLHLFNLETGELLRSFGSRTGGAIYPGISLARRIARQDAESLWAAHLRAYELELWGIDGELRLVVKRESPWFPAMRRAEVDEPPSPTVGSIWAENNSRIWVAIHIAEPDYSDHITRLDNGRLQVTGSNADLFDTIVEVIDLDAHAVLARRRFDRTLFLLGANLIGDTRVSSENVITYVVSQLSLSEEAPRRVSPQ